LTISIRTVSSESLHNWVGPEYKTTGKPTKSQSPNRVQTWIGGSEQLGKKKDQQELQAAAAYHVKGFFCRRHRAHQMESMHPATIGYASGASELTSPRDLGNSGGIATEGF